MHSFGTTPYHSHTRASRSGLGLYGQEPRSTPGIPDDDTPLCLTQSTGDAYTRRSSHTAMTRVRGRPVCPCWGVCFRLTQPPASLSS
jgi:hypothetical protein